MVDDYLPVRNRFEGLIHRVRFDLDEAWPTRAPTRGATRGHRPPVSGTMRAVVYDEIGGPPASRTSPVPAPPPGGVVVAVKATGLCRSDWHAWAGHDETSRSRTCRATSSPAPSHAIGAG